MDTEKKLQAPRLSDLLAELVDYTSMHTDQVTDFTEGSIIRSLYEAIALVLEQEYQLSTENANWAIDHAILDAFDFTPKEAQNAYGTVTVELYTPTTRDISLSRGTTVFSNNSGTDTLYFRTDQAYLIPQGSVRFKVRVVCNEAGTKGNIPANYIDSMTTTQLSILSVTNEDAFLTGREAETAEDLKKRFREFVATRARGTIRSIEYAMNSIPEVTGCYVFNHTGYYDVYVHDANGDLPDELMNKCLNAIEDYRPAGNGFNIYPMEKVKVSLQVNLAVTDVDLVTDTFRENLRKYISDYLNSFKANDDLIISNVMQKILDFSSIIKDVQFIGGATYTTSPEEIIRAGNIYITTDTRDNFNGANEIPVDGIDDDTEEPDTPTDEEPTDGGTKLLGFVYYNYSYNYSRTTDSTTPVSTTYYDNSHVIITTLPYNLGFDLDKDKDRINIDGNKYTLLNDYGAVVQTLSYDNNGSVVTEYNSKGSVDTQTAYDNYGRVTKLV